jgi:hypothetical protein
MVMAEKEIRIFDTSNAVLKAPSISFELFDAVTGTLLAVDLSRDLNPGFDEWGVRLLFTAGSTPLQVYTTDPTYRYPGNTILSLEGHQTDRIDIDLEKLPSHPGGQTSQPSSSNPFEISQWVRRNKDWIVEEKNAVLNLALNYTRLLIQMEGVSEKGLDRVEQNWRKALEIVGIDPSRLAK